MCQPSVLYDDCDLWRHRYYEGFRYERATASVTILDGGVGREAAIETVVHAVQPDILLLQEVFEDTIVRDLAQYLNMEWFCPSSNRRRRVALLSRLPIHTRMNYQQFPPIWRTIVRATIGCPSGVPTPSSLVRAGGWCIIVASIADSVLKTYEGKAPSGSNEISLVDGQPNPPTIVRGGNGWMKMVRNDCASIGQLELTQQVLIIDGLANLPAISVGGTQKVTILISMEMLFQKVTPTLLRK